MGCLVDIERVVANPGEYLCVFFPSAFCCRRAVFLDVLVRWNKY